MEFFETNIHLGEVFVQLVAFVIVFWTLKLLAWKPLLRALEARREHIKHSLEQIEAAKREIDSLKTEYAAHLQKIEEEARAKIQEAVHEGRRLARDIQEKARSESQASFEKAKQNLELEAAKARLTLRREIADLAIHAAERVLREKMTDSRQQEKVLEIIEELEKKS